MIVLQIVAFYGVILLPITSTIFCINIFSTIEKIKNQESVKVNLYWITISFVLIIWTFGSLLAILTLSQPSEF
ncbi:hypothetical protein GCM10008934_30770 [Virgibacillus salarius]